MLDTNTLQAKKGRKVPRWLPSSLLLVALGLFGIRCSTPPAQPPLLGSQLLANYADAISSFDTAALEHLYCKSIVRKSAIRLFDDLGINGRRTLARWIKAAKFDPTESSETRIAYRVLQDKSDDPGHLLFIHLDERCVEETEP